MLNTIDTLIEQTSEPERILIVDDDERNILAMKSLLKNENRELFYAYSGLEALKVLQKQAVDLILLDVQMPGPSGFDTAEMIRLRQSQRDIPIIFVTAAATSHDFVARGFASGASDYIVKPVQTDILEQKVKIFLELYRTKKASRRSAIFLNQIISDSPTGYVSLGQSGHIELANPKFESLFGIRKEEVLGKTLPELEEMLRLTGAETSREEITENEAGDHRSRIVVQTPKFKVIGRLDRALHDSNGRKSGRLITFVDITREAEVDRLKSEFMSVAAHELRTPLASILGYSELLCSREFAPDTTREIIDGIYRQSVLLNRMVNELMDLSKLENRSALQIDREVVNLQDLVTSSMEASQGREGQSRYSVGHIPDLNINCDRTKIINALTNVLTNALKYSPQKEEVTINATTQVSQDQEWVCISVEDRGIGMDDNQVKQAFERFYRADKSGSVPGTGLGLSLVREIIKIHSGSISIDSTLGKGTKVEICLPKNQPESALCAAP